MLTDDWLSDALAAGCVGLIYFVGVSAITPAGVSGRRRTSNVPPTCSCSPPASRATSSSHRWRSPAATAAPSPDAWAPSRVPTSASPYPGFPNLFLLYGPNTNGGTGSVVSTIDRRSRTCWRRCASLQRARRVDDRGPRRGRGRLQRLGPRSPGGYGLALGLHELVRRRRRPTDPSRLRPRTWTQYRRRTSELAPDAYTLSGSAAQRGFGRDGVVVGEHLELARLDAVERGAATSAGSFFGMSNRPSCRCRCRRGAGRSPACPGRRVRAGCRWSGSTAAAFAARVGVRAV